MRRAPDLLGVLTLMACAGMIGHDAKLVHEGLIGQSERGLTTCLGPPMEIILGEDERPRYWVYDFPLKKGRGQDIIIEADVSGTGGTSMRQGPRVTQGNVPTDSMKRRDPMTGGVPAGWCRLIFELKEGSVEDLSTRARSHDGMNADASCLMSISHCARE